MVSAPRRNNHSLRRHDKATYGTIDDSVFECDGCLSVLRKDVSQIDDYTYSAVVFFNKFLADPG